MDRRSWSRIDAGLVIVLAALVLLASACGAGQASAFRGGVVALTGPPGDGVISTLDGAGVWSPLSVPADGLISLAVGRAGRLAATTDDGRVLVASGEDGWRVVDLGAIPDAVEHDIFRIAWSPDDRLAVVVAQAGDGRIAGVDVIDPDEPGGLWLGRSLGFGGDPPTWIGPDRLVVPTRDIDDRPTATVLDTATGEVAQVIPGIRAISASADGATIATLGGDHRAVEVWATDGWLASDENGRRSRFEGTPDPRSVDAIGLAGAGDGLAIASSDDQDVRGATITVWDETDGTWTLALEAPLPDGAMALSLGLTP